ncbi:MAG: penicillin-binding transpeptidase domain-containing protein [bacterium]
MRIKKSCTSGSGRMRIFAVIGVIGAFWGLLWIRIFFIQIINNNSHSTQIRKQASRRVILPAIRGKILDCKGRLLADNRIQNNNEAASPYKNAGRIYPGGRLAGQVLGFVGRDANGLCGVEYEFDSFLRGSPGWALVRCDGRQSLNHIAEFDRIGKKSNEGLTLVLTIDMDIQTIAEEALDRGMISTKAKNGCVIILEPETGRILAIANAPFFDLNKLNRTNSQSKWRNYAVSCIYEPGSTFKLITLAAALEENNVTEGRIIDAGNGKLAIFGQTIHDVEPHKQLSVREAWIHSSNVCFARIGRIVGSQNMYKYARSFGMGSKTGIILPGEENGILNPLKKWSGRTLVTMAMGHEISVTPMQMIMAYGAIANNGVLMKPQIICELKEKGMVKRSFVPEAVRQVVSPEISARILSMMGDVVEYGTGKKAHLPDFNVGGKTGTSQKIDIKTNAYLNDRYIASFVGLAPLEKPLLVCMVVLDEPVSPHSGGSAAGPIFHDVMTHIIQSPNLDYGYLFSKYRRTETTKALCRKEIKEKSNNEISDSVNERKLSDRQNTEDNTVFPHLEGLPLRQALLILKDFNIEVTVNGHGIVKEQQPVSGTPVKKVSRCRLVAG